MKKYSTLFVVLITTLLVFLLTWILPITYLNGEFVEMERTTAGLAELFNYPLYTFYNFIYVLVYILIVGALYGILSKVKAYRVLLDRVVSHVKKHEKLSLILTVLISSIIVSFTGFSFEAIVFIPFIASVVFLLGYDKITALLVSIGSVVVGFIGTTFSSIVAGTFNGILNTNFTDLLLPKFILILLGSALLIWNIIAHNRHVETCEKIEDSIFVPSECKEKNIRIWPLATLLISFITIMVISTIAWKETFKIEFFDSLNEKINAMRILGAPFVLIVAALVIIILVITTFVKNHRNKELSLKELISKKSIVIASICFIIALICFGHIIKIRYRFIALAICGALLLLTVVRYIILKTKSNANNKKKDNVKFFANKLHLISFCILAVIVILIVLELILGSKFEVSSIVYKLKDILDIKTIKTEFTIGKLLGSVGAFGTWTYNEYTVMMIILMIILKFVYKINVTELVGNVGDGVKRFIYAALVAILSYAVLIFTVNNPVMLTILKPILLLTDGLNNFTLSFATFFSALFNSDLIYYQNSILPLTYVTTYITDSSLYPLCELITQSMYGLAMLVAPTSVILLFGLSVLKVRYLEWLKNIWKLFVELLVVLLITFTIVLLVI